MKMLFKWAIGAFLAIAVIGSAALASPGQRVRVYATMAAWQGTCGPGADGLEQRIVSMFRDAKYLGFRCDPTTNIYTFKFLRNGTVIWVDVDGRTGRIVRRTGG